MKQSNQLTPISKNKNFTLWFEKDMLSVTINKITQKNINKLIEGLTLAGGIASASQELQELIYSEQLQKAFIDIETSNKIICDKFFMKFFEFEVILIYEFELPEKLETFLYYCAHRYYDMWLLIRSSFKFIKNKLPTKFDNAEQLFLHIVKYELSCWFESLMIQPYLQIKKSSLLKGIDTQIKGEGCEKREIHEIFSRNGENNPWHKEVIPALSSCTKKQREKGKIDYHFALMQTTESFLWEANRELVTARGSQGHLLFKDFVWDENASPNR